MDIRLKETDFELNGKTYKLRCNMNVLADVQEAFGGYIGKSLEERNIVRSVMEFLAAMMNDYLDEQGDPERFTAKELGRIIKPGRMNEIRGIVMPLVLDAISSDSDEPQQEIQDEVEYAEEAAKNG